MTTMAESSSARNTCKAFFAETTAHGFSQVVKDDVGMVTRIVWGVLIFLAMAIGIGVNLAAAPVGVEGASFPPVTLAGEGGTPTSPDDMLTRLAANIVAEERSFSAHGFEPARTRWLQRAARLGEVITARTAQTETTGTFETIDAFGQLVLSTPKGQVAIPAGDVFF